MKNTVLRTLSLAVALLGPLALAVGCSDSGSKQMTHTETTKKGWFGGQTHEVNTAYKNTDGSSSIESETTTTKDGTTTIVREKKTTNAEGVVKTDRETRTIVKGSDNKSTETTTTN